MVGLQHGQLPTPCFDCLVEPLEGAVLVSKADVDHRDEKRRGGARFGQTEKVVQGFQRLASASRPSQCARVERDHIGSRSRQGACFFRLRDGSVWHALAQVREPEHRVGHAEVGIELERLFEWSHGIIEATGKVEHHPDVHLNVG